MRTGTPAIDVVETVDRDWLHWVEGYEKANIFHHPAWTDLLSTCYGYRPFVLLTRNGAGQITGGIPMMELKGITGGKRWTALPFTDHCAPLANDSDALNELCQGVSAAYQQADLKELEMRWNIASIHSAQQTSHHVLHLLNLEDDPDRVYKRLQSAHRRNIKTALNSNLRIEQGRSEKHLREFYRLHVLTRRRQGMPTQPWRFFQLIGKMLFSKDLGFVILAYKDEACIAASVFLKWQKTLTYKYGASTPDSLQFRPNNLVMWTAIRWGCENGFTVFDFGRTDNENTGLRSYKSGWGAQELPLVYTVLSSKPVKNGSGRLLPLIQEVIRKSPNWVGQLTGQLFYRFFG